MMRESVRTLFATVIILGAVGLPRAAAAQGPAPSADGRYDARLPERLHLTQEQAQKLDEIRAKHEAKLLSLEEEVASKRKELDATEASPGADPQRVARLRQQVIDLGGRLEALQMEVNASAKRILTREQLALFPAGFDLFDGEWGWSCPWDRHWTHNVATDYWRGGDCGRWWCSGWRYAAGPTWGNGGHCSGHGGCCW